jgi:hypothetical protein
MFPGSDAEAMAVLVEAGWSYFAGWWTPPTHRKPSDYELDAITYLIDEWDHAISGPV